MRFRFVFLIDLNACGDRLMDDTVDNYLEGFPPLCSCGGAIVQ